MSSFSAIFSNSYAKTSANEYSRIISAAVVNQKFCKMLLSNPAQALSSGYGGESFHLKAEERERLSAIHASTLSDFAAQLAYL
ncbi:MAG: hypothetical protein ABFD14_07710 [Anaerolineaceae bacterium]